MATVRNERPGDVAAIAATVSAAFAAAAHADGNEAEIVDRLRAAGALRLSLVAEENGDVVGHLGASPAAVGAASGWMAIAPVSVRPALQRRGIGTLLMRAALGRLRAAGVPGAVLVGDAGYYGRFGFAARAGLGAAGIPAEHVLALAFGSEAPRGEVVFHPAFGLA